jgi:hypothetical protein
MGLASIYTTCCSWWRKFSWFRDSTNKRKKENKTKAASTKYRIKIKKSLTLIAFSLYIIV